MNQPFEKLGPYRVTGVLGRGGMGTVYRGVDRESGQEAAIKVLSPALAAESGFRERFAAEIQTLQKLRQPNIVKLFGFGEDAGHLYYAMELIHGESLQGELKKGRRFQWREVVDIGIQICAALKHAHEHGVIHRDLKPANLLLDQDDCIKLFDFGIAKLFGSTNVTTDTVLGTADFMAPEQAEGKMAGQKTDLYSLGSVLYALLSGRAPFTGKSVAEVVHKLRFDQPIPVGRFSPEIPRELEELIDQLLDKNPDRRVPTALALSHRLKAISESRTVRPDSNAADEIQVFTKSIKDLGHTVKSERIANRPTIAVPEPTGNDEESEESAETAPQGTHFVAVDKVKSQKQRNWPAAWMGFLRFAALIAAIGSLGFLFRLFLQPPSADQMYLDIKETVREEDPRTFLQAKPDLFRFKRLYPVDDRVQEIEVYLEDAEAYQLRRRLEANVRRAGIDSATPIEQLYLEAVRNIQSNPDLAATQLRALVTLHESDLGMEGLEDLESIETVQCLRFAKKRLQRLEKSIESNRKSHRVFAKRSIARAIEISTSHPQRARQAIQCIIELYSSKPWMTEIISQADQALSDIPLQPTTKVPPEQPELDGGKSDDGKSDDGKSDDGKSDDGDTQKKIAPREESDDGSFSFSAATGP